MPAPYVLSRNSALAILPFVLNISHKPCALSIILDTIYLFNRIGSEWTKGAFTVFDFLYIYIYVYFFYCKCNFLMTRSVRLLVDRSVCCLSVCLSVIIFQKGFKLHFHVTIGALVLIYRFFLLYLYLGNIILVLNLCIPKKSTAHLSQFSIPFSNRQSHPLCAQPHTKPCQQKLL